MWAFLLWVNTMKRLHSGPCMINSLILFQLYHILAADIALLPAPSQLGPVFEIARNHSSYLAEKVDENSKLDLNNMNTDGSCSFTSSPPLINISVPLYYEW